MLKHKRILRILALILCVTTLFTSMHLELLAKEETDEIESFEEVEDDFNATETESFEGDESFDELVNETKPYIVAEVTDKRTANSKTFRLSDGSYTVATYNQVIHYKTEEGNYEQIDNKDTHKHSKALEETGQREYNKCSGEYKIYFRERSKKGKNHDGIGNDENTPSVVRDYGNHEVSIEVDGSVISWGYDGLNEGEIIWQENTQELTGDDAFLSISGVNSYGLYEDAFLATDIEYVISDEGIKENFILKSKDAPNEWVLQMNIGNLRACQEDTRTIKLYQKEYENPVFVISAPYMKDANGIISTDVSLDMKQQGNRLTVVITADKEFLEDGQRAYPVTVDPYFILYSNENVSISDIYVAENYPDTNMHINGYDTASLIVGRESSMYGKCRSLLKMNELPQLPAGSVITEAYLCLQNYYSYSNDKSMIINVRNVTSDWDEDTATWNNSYNICDELISAYTIVTQNEREFIATNTWEITRLMKGWYDGSIPNYGVMLTCDTVEASSSGYSAKYYAENYYRENLRPYFCVSFRCNEGLEDYWTYHSQSVNGGVGYVNDYSGNLTYVIPVAQTTGLNMPISLNLVYLSSRSNELGISTKGSACGYGWMLNYAQRVDKVEDVARYSSITEELKQQGFDYVWLDGDGTYHFFKKESEGVYKDEDGLGLTLEIGETYSSLSNARIITDKSGYKYVFSSTGSLTYISNDLGKTVQLTYDANNNLTRITDGANRSITISYNGSVISTITDPQGTTSLTYSANKLTKVTFYDATSITLSSTTKTIYDTTYYLINYVRGRDGYGIHYAYVTGGDSLNHCKVSSVRERSSSNTLGNQLIFNYKKANQTEITYIKASGTLYETYQFDTWGHTTGVIAADGSMVELGYNCVESDGTTTQLSANHKITKSGSSIACINNLLKNHSVEDSTVWCSESSGDTTVTFTRNRNPYLGYRSLGVTQNDANPQYCGWKQKVEVTSGETYTFSAYVKTQNIDDSGTGGATLYVTFYNGSVELETVVAEQCLKGDNDWKRISMTFIVPDEADSVYVYAGLSGANGSAWFDCLQLEVGKTANPYNLLEDAYCSDEDGWGLSNTCNDTDGYNEGVLCLQGSVTDKKYASQYVMICKGGTAFCVSASAKATAAANDVSKEDQPIRFAIAVKYTYVIGNTETFYKYFNTDVTSLQRITFTVAPSEAYKDYNIECVNVYLIYERQINTVEFDDIMLTMDETGTSYAYDEEGNLITSSDNANRNTTYSIDTASNMITSITDSSNTTYSYVYDETNKKQLVSAKENSTGVGFEYTYGTGNNKGNVTNIRMGIVGNSENHKYIESSTSYTANGAYVKDEYSQLNNHIVYDVDEQTGQITSVTDSLGATVDYTYDATTRNLTSVQSGTSAVAYTYATATYGYRLTDITTASTTYNFAYDVFGNLTEITLNSSKSLVKYTYAGGNGNLMQVDYGNGQRLYYLYDKYDRVVSKRAATSSTSSFKAVATYTYNASGQLARVVDGVNARETNYTYDIAGRLTDYHTTEGDIAYGYDNQNRTSKVETTFDGESYNSTYTYLSANRSGQSILPIGTINRDYDELQREEAHLITAADTGITLKSVASFKDLSGNRTTELVERYLHYVGTEEGGYRLLDNAYGFCYYYDVAGNIRAKEDLSTGTHTVYRYDELNQLIREDDNKRGITILYTYDTAGNLLKKDIYSYSTGTPSDLQDRITYQYDISTWKDLLTAYNGNSITYDGLGNPKKYYNGAYFTWTQGRLLTSLTYNEKNISYQYNENGIRIGKTVGSKHTTYLVDASGTIQALEQGAYKLIFSYDSTGRREGFSFYYADTFVGHFYYLYNAQGDVTNILNEDMYVVVTYEYDSWGKLLSCVGNAAEELGVLNPFRYRGYIYDEETGFYYLNSRYYDPETGRFINADGYVSTGQGVLGYNMFAYCLNNPVNYVDKNGTYAEALQWWTSTMWWLCGADAVLPVGDIIYGAGILILGIYALTVVDNVKTPQISLEEVNDEAEPEPPDVTYPGDDPTRAPEGTEWKGKGEQGSNQGNYHNPQTGESWHPDLKHPEPIGPHWDYRDPSGIWWRVGPDGMISLK